MKRATLGSTKRSFFPSFFFFYFCVFFFNDTATTEIYTLSLHDALPIFITSNGVSKAEFLKAWDSFDVDKKIRIALQLSQKYGIRSVPNMVVDGRYVVGADSAGSQVKMMQVVDYLVNKIAKEKK